MSEERLVELPSWADCEFAVDEKTAGPVERFIYEYEPGDNDVEWRERLSAALSAAKQQGREEQRESLRKFIDSALYDEDEREECEYNTGWNDALGDVLAAIEASGATNE